MDECPWMRFGDPAHSMTRAGQAGYPAATALQSSRTLRLPWPHDFEAAADRRATGPAGGEPGQRQHPVRRCRGGGRTDPAAARAPGNAHCLRLPVAASRGGRLYPGQRGAVPLHGGAPPGPAAAAPARGAALHPVRLVPRTAVHPAVPAGCGLVGAADGQPRHGECVRAAGRAGGRRLSTERKQAWS